MFIRMKCFHQLRSVFQRHFCFLRQILSNNYCLLQPIYHHRPPFSRLSSVPHFSFFILKINEILMKVICFFFFSYLCFLRLSVCYSIVESWNKNKSLLRNKCFYRVCWPKSTLFLDLKVEMKRGSTVKLFVIGLLEILTQLLLTDNMQKINK